MTNEVRRAIDYTGELGKRAEALLRTDRPDRDDLEAVRAALQTNFEAAQAEEVERLTQTGDAEKYWQAVTQRIAHEILLRETAKLLG